MQKSRTVRIVAGVALVAVGVLGFLASSPARADFLDTIRGFFAAPAVVVPAQVGPAPTAALYKPAENYESAVVAAVDTAAPSG